VNAGEPGQEFTCFKCYSSKNDPRQLLDPENHVSEPWGGHDKGPCDKCGGEASVAFECLSCVSDGVDPECPACDGRMRWVAACPTCEGSGEITRTTRRGVSVFPKVGGLLAYLAEENGDFSDDVIVELEGELTGDVDLDAERGAVLVRPTRVVAVHEIDVADVS
jgi:hypothetical protein